MNAQDTSKLKVTNVKTKKKRGKKKRWKPKPLLKKLEWDLKKAPKVADQVT